MVGGWFGDWLFGWLDGGWLVWLIGGWLVVRLGWLVVFGPLVCRLVDCRIGSSQFGCWLIGWLVSFHIKLIW